MQVTSAHFARNVLPVGPFSSRFLRSLPSRRSFIGGVPFLSAFLIPFRVHLQTMLGMSMDGNE